MLFSAPYGDPDSVVAALKSEEPSADAHLLRVASGLDFCAAEVRRPALRLMRSRQAMAWLITPQVAFGSDSHLGLSVALSRHIVDVMEAPVSDEERDAEASISAIYRMSFAGPSDLLTAAALGRSVLFRVNIPIHVGGPTYRISMVLQGSDLANPVFPAPGLAVLDRAEDDAIAAIAREVNIPIRRAAT